MTGIRRLRRVPSRMTDADPAAAVYGLIAIGALLAAESGLHESYLDTLLSGIVAATLYWLLHAYSRVLGGRLAGGDPLTARVLMHALRLDYPLMAGAAIPLGLVLIAWAAGAEQETAVLIALWGCIASLLVFELVAGLRSRARPAELALQAGIGVALGLAIIALKVILH
jgi:hypothetical protein